MHARPSGAKVTPREVTPFHNRHAAMSAVAHCGALEVRTTEGIGSRINLCFPAKKVALPSVTIEQTEVGDAARNARIMIVDDNVDVADTLSISLSSMGYQTAVFYEPLQAYDVLLRKNLAGGMLY
jgi:hypothetical protein